MSCADQWSFSRAAKNTLREDGLGSCEASRCATLSSCSSTVKFAHLRPNDSICKLSLTNPSLSKLSIWLKKSSRHVELMPNECPNGRKRQSSIFHVLELGSVSLQKLWCGHLPRVDMFKLQAVQFLRDQAGLGPETPPNQAAGRGIIRRGLISSETNSSRSGKRTPSWPQRDCVWALAS